MKKKLLKKIKENEKNISNQYFKIVKRIIEKDPKYYEDKVYIKRILDRKNN